MSETPPTGRTAAEWSPITSPRPATPAQPRAELPAPAAAEAPAAPVKTPQNEARPTPATTPKTSAATSAETVQPAQQARPAAAGPASTVADAPQVQPSPSAGLTPDAVAAQFAHRRRSYKRALVTVAAVAAGAWFLWPSATDTTAAGPGQGPFVHRQAVKAPDRVQTDMTVVHKHLKKGTLDDVALPGARIAAAGRTLYVARVIDSTCLVYGVIDGADIDPQADPSGAACTEAIAQVQQQLDANEQARRAAINEALKQALTSAADSASFYASSNYRNGQPSLSGLTTQDLGTSQQVRISANHGSYARLTARAEGVCRTALVDPYGELGEISPC